MKMTHIALHGGDFSVQGLGLRDAIGARWAPDMRVLRSAPDMRVLRSAPDMRVLRSTPDMRVGRRSAWL